jgi:phage FluMu protein Com
MGFFRFGENKKDDGAYLIWKCPKCEEQRHFHLIESHVQMQTHGVTLGEKNTMLDLRCATCAYELRVSPTERELVEQAHALTQDFQQGKLTAEAYAAKIKELPARFIRDLLALTMEWKCPGCGEANPITFDVCWNCQSKQIKGSIQLTEDVKPLPGFKTHTNPWDV